MHTFIRLFSHANSSRRISPKLVDSPKRHWMATHVSRACANRDFGGEREREREILCCGKWCVVFMKNIKQIWTNVSTVDADRELMDAFCMWAMCARVWVCGCVGVLRVSMCSLPQVCKSTTWNANNIRSGVLSAICVLHSAFRHLFGSLHFLRTIKPNEPTRTHTKRQIFGVVSRALQADDRKK